MSLIAALGTACVMLAVCAPVGRAQEHAERLLLTSDFRTVEADKPSVAFATPGEAPKIDGEFLDAAWGERPGLAVASDVPGGAVSRKTVARIYHDDEDLFIGFECREPAIDNLPPVEDPPRDIWARDDFRIYLAPPREDNNIFILALDTSGAKVDWSLREGLAWDPEWTSTVVRERGIWRGEVRIPLKSLGVDKPVKGAVWRVNFGRNIGTTGEQCAWHPTSGNRRNPQRWGYLFFGERADWKPPPYESVIRLAPLRWALNADDYALRVVAAIVTTERIPKDAKLRISVLPERPDAEAKAGDGAPPTAGQPSATQTIPVKGNRASLALKAGMLPTGPFQLTADLLDAVGKTLASGRASLTKKAAPPSPAPVPTAEGEEPKVPPPERIELHVPEYKVQTAAAKKWPVTTGVALPKGAMTRPTDLRMLGPDGVEIPCQASVRARWPSDGSIRWLGLDFQADIRRPGGARYVLEYGPGVKAKPVTGFIRDQKWRHLPFEPVEQEWLINTGPLLFTIHSERFTGIHEAWIDVDSNGFYDWNEQVINATRKVQGIMAGAGPYITDASGWTYRLQMDPDVRVDLEEWNELRIVLRGEARLLLDRDARAKTVAESKPPAGVNMGQCVVRIFAYAGHPFIRLQYSFYLNRTGANSLIADVGILEKIDFRKGYDTVLGIPQGYRKPIAETGAVSLLKPRPRHFYVLRPDAKTPLVLEGADAKNWACAAAKDRGLAVCIRDMDKLYPKEIELRPEGAVIAHLWPPHGSGPMRESGQSLDRRTVGGLEFAHFAKLLNLSVPPEHSTTFRDTEGLRDGDALLDMHRSEPTGVAITCDLLYIFYAGKLNTQDLSEIARAFQLAPHAVQDRKSLIRSGVLSEVLPPARARRAVGLAHRLLANEERLPEAGMFNYMDLHSRWLPTEKRWPLRDRWTGTRTDVPGMLWTLYLQTGDPSLFSAAERNLTHVMSVDFCHAATPEQGAATDPRLRNIAGAFGDATTPVHWHATRHVNDRYARLRAPVMASLVAGNQWAREMVREWGTAVKAHGACNHGADGVAFLDNLRQVLRLEYDGVLHEKYANCASYLFETPVNLAEQQGWLASLRYYGRQTGDPRAAAYLAALRHGQKAPSSFEALCLLRDLAGDANDSAYRNAAAKLIGDFEKNADRVLKGSLTLEAAGITWETLAIYVFGAGEPSS